MLSDWNARYISLIKNLALKVVGIKRICWQKDRTSRAGWMWTDNADLWPGLKERKEAIGVEWRFYFKEQFHGIPK